MNLHVPSPAEITARRARLMGPGRVVNLAVKPKLVEQQKRPDSPADAHVKAYADYLAQIDKCPSPTLYIRMRCEALGVDYADLISRDRSVDMVSVRYILIREVKARYPHMSAPQIGWAFQRGHNIVLNALKGIRPKPRQFLAPEKIDDIRRLYAEGKSINAIRKAVGCSEDAVKRYAVEGYAEKMRQRKREERRRRAKP